MAQFGRTWWGQRFLQAIESFTDPGRLARGRGYVRNGKIHSYTLNGGTVTAKVRGSVNPYWGVYREPIYHIEIIMTPIPFAEWMGIIDHLAGNARSVAQLLMNEMPDTIDDAFSAAGRYLLPWDESDFTTSCSCPDWDNPCKHMAGVFYLLAADLDRDPFLLFELRGIPRKALRAQLARSPLGQALVKELEEPYIPITPVASHFSTPLTEPAEATSYHDFWSPPHRLPDLGPPPTPTVPGLLAKKGGEYPAFWRKSTSFTRVMDDLYDRVRSKSEQLK